jgi:hypothetical protein
MDICGLHLQPNDAQQTELSCPFTHAHLTSNPNSSSAYPPNTSQPKNRKWTAEEDKLLRATVGNHGERNWSKISQSIPGRTAIQCLHRWSKILKPGLIKGQWIQEEDEVLRNWVLQHGPRHWAQAALQIPGRTGKQCRERWSNSLNPGIRKSEWTPDEDLLIYDLYKIHGSSWSRIAKHVPGRTENSIKNRFYSTLRRISAESKKSGGLPQLACTERVLPDHHGKLYQLLNPNLLSEGKPKALPTPPKSPASRHPSDGLEHLLLPDSLTSTICQVQANETPHRNNLASLAPDDHYLRAIETLCTRPPASADVPSSSEPVSLTSDVQRCCELLSIKRSLRLDNADEPAHPHSYKPSSLQPLSGSRQRNGVDSPIRNRDAPDIGLKIKAIHERLNRLNQILSIARCQYINEESNTHAANDTLSKTRGSCGVNVSHAQGPSLQTADAGLSSGIEPCNDMQVLDHYFHST